MNRKAPKEVEVFVISGMEDLRSLPPLLIDCTKAGFKATDEATPKGFFGLAVEAFVDSKHRTAANRTKIVLVFMMIVFSLQPSYSC